MTTHLHPARRRNTATEFTQAAGDRPAALDALALLDPESQRVEAERETSLEQSRARTSRRNDQSYYGLFRRWVEAKNARLEELGSVQRLERWPIHPQVLAHYAQHLALTTDAHRADGSASGGRGGRPTLAEGRAASTVSLHVNGLGKLHERAGLVNPAGTAAVKDALAGIKRRQRDRSPRSAGKRTPLLLDGLRQTVGYLALPTPRQLADAIAVGLLAHEVGPGQLRRLQAADLRVLDDRIELDIPAATRSTRREHTIVLDAHDADVAPLYNALLLVAQLRSLHQAPTEPVSQLLPWVGRSGQLDWTRQMSRQSIAARYAQVLPRIGRACASGAIPDQLTNAEISRLVTELTLVASYDRIRDRALLVLGWHWALRRSNLATLRIDQAWIRDSDATTYLAPSWSKTRQTGDDREGALGVQCLCDTRLGPSVCPHHALHALLAATARELGLVGGIGELITDHGDLPLFLRADEPLPAVVAHLRKERKRREQQHRRRAELLRAARRDGQLDDNSVGLLLAEELPEGLDAVEAAPVYGLSPDSVTAIAQTRIAATPGMDRDAQGRHDVRWGAHSLRRGWVTQAVIHGVPTSVWMAWTDHQSATVALGYADMVDRMTGTTASAALLDAAIAPHEESASPAAANHHPDVSPAATSAYNQAIETLDLLDEPD